jgi:hypothetical protein
MDPVYFLRVYLGLRVYEKLFSDNRGRATEERNRTLVKVPEFQFALVNT